MSGVETLPAAVAALVGALVVAGAALALVGSIGLLRMKTFYDRLHPPTMGTTGGVTVMLAASVVMFSVLESRPVVHEILIGVFMLVTTPVTFMLLVRAAVHRESASPATRVDIEPKPPEGPEKRAMNPEHDGPSTASRSGALDE